MLSPRSDVVTIASLVGENAALADENATLRLRADSRRIMAACGTSSSSAAHFPTIPADEDYAICAWVEVDLNRYPPGEPWSPQSVRVKYFLEAGRTAGAWRLLLQQVLVEDGVGGLDILGPALIDVEGQTDSSEPLALLQTVLGGQMALDPQRWIHELPEDEIAVLHALSPEDQAAVIEGLQDHGSVLYRLTRAFLRDPSAIDVAVIKRLITA